MGKEALNEDKPMLPPNVKPINKAKSLWGTSFKSSGIGKFFDPDA